ncbi:alpha/beta hydrolase domain-containing protein [Actinoallomurus spadix]|uniref:Alpha/beta hydrolase domain-containing protein n=1 Tax=Actinoallomurus spadix TaxID=79912 RepID=A0ABP3HG91_9ACTN|nr:alpha/beta hydrolase domain-containing protein [Actinoallomurus spadix]MCO5988344.1 alpha/beta hydrolase domain-containing protein [Actinoallomurus spadix]
MRPLVRFPRRRSVAAVLAAMLCAVFLAAPPARATGRPAITVPPGGGHGFPFLAAAEDLGSFGYTESEYFITGTATAYAPSGIWTSDGRWGVRPSLRAPYRTRILVRRPTDPAKFNGTVVVEWLNVSGQLDLSPDYWFARDELLRHGYAWVGVSAQAVGVNGGLGQIHGLKGWDPARYGTLFHPGDAFAYDIFSQAGQALRAPDGPDPLGGLRVRTLLADGESQSAGFMTTYVDAVQPVAGVYDGFMIHSNGAVAAPITGNAADMLLVPNPSRIRTDLSVPTFVVLTETDVPLASAARQPDTNRVVHWELAGTSHGDQWAYDLGDPTVQKSAGSAAPQPGCAAGSAPYNDGPGHYAMNAALRHLTGWAQGGPRPPGGPVLNTDARDPSTGLATGGIRLPDVAVPTRTLTGLRDTSGSGVFCGLYGARDPWNGDADPWDRHDAGDPSDPAAPLTTEPVLSRLYPTHEDYVGKVRAAAQASVTAGYLLPEDATTIVTAAQNSAIGG